MQSIPEATLKFKQAYAGQDQAQGSSLVLAFTRGFHRRCADEYCMSEISEANPRDPLIAARIYSLQQEAYSLEAQLIGCLDFPPLRETVEELPRSSDCFLTVADAEQLLGVLSFCRDGDQVLITRLLVSPSHLRRGIATALVSALIERIPRTATIFVTTAEANAPAVSLYTNLGFRISSTSLSREGIALVHLRKEKRGAAIRQDESL